jgi:pSer/pThr/pTyr-binding forkhead associated (FHA) protein
MAVEAAGRIVSLVASGALGAFVLLAWPHGRRRAEPADDGLGRQALELRVEEKGEARVVRAPVPVTIGRSPEATLVLSDAQVSRMHARIDQVDGTLLLRDLQSRNGTFLNARLLEDAEPIAVGDEIDLGFARISVIGLARWT